MSEEAHVRIYKSLTELDLTPAEWRTVFAFIKFAEYDKNTVNKTIIDIAEATSQGENTIQRALKSLIEKNVIRKTKEKQRITITLNPTYLGCGAQWKLDKNLTELFKEK